jgi:hypothetical protein
MITTMLTGGYELTDKIGLNFTAEVKRRTKNAQKINRTTLLSR